MDKFYSINEAAAFSGKSQSTIKRLINPIRNDEDHPDREFLVPSPDEYARLKREGQPYNWRIAESFLLRKFPKADVQGESDRSPTASNNGVDRELYEALSKTISILENQLSEKDSQIREKDHQLREKDELINKFGGMTRELQSQLLLGAGQTRSRNESDVGQTEPFEEGHRNSSNSSNEPSFSDRHLPNLKRLFKR